MCNRYAQTKDSARIRINTVSERQMTFTTRYNICPTQQIDVVLLERGDLVQRQMKWGWHHKKFGSITNAQAETASQKMFKDAWKARRCLVPADGYYEWKQGTPAQPYLITMATRKLFWFAGLWQPGEVLILTKPASGFITSIHDREPIVLAEKELDWWLNDSEEYYGHEGWAVIRRSVATAAFEACPVTPQMSNPRFESPECVQTVPLQQIDLIPRAIDDSRHRWLPMTDDPPIEKGVDVLLDNDEVVYAQFNGRNWTWVRFPESHPVRWRPQIAATSVNSSISGR
jgi:putative SOS response-associated peptidase YedK